MRSEPGWRSKTAKSLAFVVAIVAATPEGAVADAPEIQLQAGTASYASEESESSDTQWALLRVSWGDRLLLRAELPWLSYDGEGISSPAGVGPIAPNPRRRERAGTGGGSNGSGGSNGGAGSNGAAGAQPGSVVTVAGVEGEAPSSSDSGLGDLRLGAHYRLAGGGVRRHRLDLGLSVKVPTADEETLLGTGETDWRVGLSGEYRFWPLTVFGGAGFNHFGDPEGVEFEDVPDVYAGIESLPLAERFLLAGWVEANSEVVAGEGDRVAVGASVRTQGNVRFELLARAGLTDGAERFSASLGIAFGLRPPVSGPSGVRR